MTDEQIVNLCTFRNGLPRSRFMVHGSQANRIFVLAGRLDLQVKEDVFYIADDAFHDVWVRRARVALMKSATSDRA